MKYVYCLLFMFMMAVSLGSIAHGADGTLLWDPPTTYVDNTAIEPAKLNSQAFYRIYSSDNPNDNSWVRTFLAPNGVDWSWVNYPGTEFSSSEFVDGRWYTLTFVIQKDASLPINHKDANGVEDNKIWSDFAVPVQFLVSAPPPPTPPPSGKKPTPPGHLRFRSQ